jgi:two-component system nitrogen regulation response regulator GlnG
VDVRIIAATHQNLERLVEQGSFREDLYHRLNVIRIHLPRLSERREDIPLLARHFLKAAAAELGGETKVLRPETEQYLAGLPWPGNVRQLENTCRWLTVMASGREVYVDDLPPELRAIESSGTSTSDWETALARWAHEELSRLQPGNGVPLLDTAIPRFERIVIEAALARSGGRRRDASVLLGWGRNTLTRKMKELDMKSAGE